jgi:hypothetical protein
MYHKRRFNDNLKPPCLVRAWKYFRVGPYSDMLWPLLILSIIILIHCAEAP